MNTEQPYVSVIDPLNPAIQRSRKMLFEPFDLGKWFVIGFCAWLAQLGNFGGGGGGGPGSPGRYRQGFTAEDISYETREAFREATEFITENLHWIIPAVIFGAIVLIILWVLITWLSSRGRFMFLHCVAHNAAEIRIPWTKFRQHADSLFFFRIALALIALGVMGLICIPAFLIGAAIASTGFGHGTAVVGAAAIFLIILFVVIVLVLIQKFTTDFVVPIMFLKTTSCTVAWREFLTLLSANKARFALYVLFQIVIGMAIGVIILAAVCVTCCCAACILAIPYIGTVLMLPLLIFQRAYSLYYLGQFGSQYDIFSAEDATVTPV
jgi:hypothetical protein